MSTANCPAFAPSVQPIVREYCIATAQMQTKTHLYCHMYTIPSTHIHSVHHLSCSCPIIRPSLLPMSCQNTTSTAMFSQFVISPALTKSEYHLSAHAQSVTTSPAKVRSVHYLSCSFPVRIPPPLPMFSQYITSLSKFSHLSCHVHSEYLHFWPYAVMDSCQWSASTTYLQPMGS